MTWFERCESTVQEECFQGAAGLGDCHRESKRKGYTEKNKGHDLIISMHKQCQMIHRESKTKGVK